MKRIALTFLICASACGNSPGSEVTRLQELQPMAFYECEPGVKVIPERSIVQLKGASGPLHYVEATSFRSVKGTLGCAENAWVHIAWYSTTGELLHAIEGMRNYEIVEYPSTN